MIVVSRGIVVEGVANGKIGSLITWTCGRDPASL